MDSLASATPVEAKVKIACIQMQPTIGNVEANVAHSIELIARAVGISEAEGALFKASGTRLSSAASPPNATHGASIVDTPGSGRGEYWLSQSQKSDAHAA